jgi:endonuclease YncB( thermonuclease family)
LRDFRLFGMVAGTIALSIVDARAQVRPLAPTACKTEALAGGKVAAVVDGRSFTLEDGREIRLAGIEAPFPAALGETGARAEAGTAARAALTAMVAGQNVELRQTSATADRYGRILAFAFVERDGVPVSVAHEMLAKGLARVSGQIGDQSGGKSGDKSGNLACAAELLGKERGARDGKLGLWGERYYAVVGAESFDELVAERGRFTVVEGKVLSVRESGGTIYMNFGRRWSQALTVTILKRNERIFTAAGLDPKKLENRRLRVRGWVEERSGPRIEATRPEQIEIAERN